jgi:Protein of unknown function (DUF2637)
VSRGLRAARTVALVAIAVLILAASAASFTESFRGLYEWAAHHGLHGTWAFIWPLQLDVFIATGELALLVGLTDRWQRRDRIGAWLVTGLGAAPSLAANVGHVRSADWTSRLTAAVPPLAAAAALAVGLGVLKRVVGSSPSPVAISASAPVRQSRDESAGRHSHRTPQTRHGRRTQPVRRSAADWDTAALVVLAGEPQMSIAELAHQLGTSERTASRIRQRLASPGD